MTDYPFTVFKTRSLSERFPLRTDHGTSALTRAGIGPTWFTEKVHIMPSRSQNVHVKKHKWRQEHVYVCESANVLSVDIYLNK